MLFKKETENINKEWTFFCQKYYFDSKYFYCIERGYLPATFNQKQIEKMINQLSAQDEAGHANSIISRFPQIKLPHQPLFKDMRMLKDLVQLLLERYYFLMSKSNKLDQICLPITLSSLLNQIFQFFNCQICYSYPKSLNWKIQNHIFSQKQDLINLQDIQLKWYLTEDFKIDEKILNGINFLGNYYGSRIFKELFEVEYFIGQAPWFPDQIQKRLNNCVQLWQKLNQQCQKIFALDVAYFQRKFEHHYTYRNKNDNTNVNQNDSIYFKLASFPCNLSFNPVYRLVDNLLGINFSTSNPDFQEIRQRLANFIPKIYVQSIQNTPITKNIPQFCSQTSYLTTAYNKILTTYINFNKIYVQFIHKYICLSNPGMSEVQPFKCIMKNQKIIEQHMLNYEK